MFKKLTIYDTTLRDGEQAEGIAFTVEDKLRITRLLDQAGFHFVEGGWPGSNPKAVEYFQKAKKLDLAAAKVTAFGSTKRAGKKASEDKNLLAILEAGVGVACIFGKAWDFHVKNALGISLEENLELIEDSIRFLKDNLPQVFFDAEHFFDGYKKNPDYAIRSLKAAEAAGADLLVLCDTNGGSLPSEVGHIIREVKKHITAPLGMHAHNDSELAVANSLAAVEAGAVQVQGTVNGYGERSGNANLCSIIPALQIKMGQPVVSEQQLLGLTELSRHVSEIANQAPNDRQPYVGQSAFAHKAGIHVSAVLKHPDTYEHIQPELVGNQRRVVVSELAGVSNLAYKAKEYGVDLSKDTPEVKQLLARIKELEHFGYQFEEGEASFELLMHKALGQYRKFFTLAGFEVEDEKVGQRDLQSKAVIKVTVGRKKIRTSAAGDGPVNALDNALRKALEPIYPEIKKVKLADYKVRVLNSKEGTAAKVRVLITSSDGTKSWGTVGVSTNIIEASWAAMVDALEYKLNELADWQKVG